MNLNYNHIHI